MLYNLQAFFCQHQQVFQAVLQEEGWPHLDSLLTRCVVKFSLQYHDDSEGNENVKRAMGLD